MAKIEKININSVPYLNIYAKTNENPDEYTLFKTIPLIQRIIDNKSNTDVFEDKSI